MGKPKKRKKRKQKKGPTPPKKRSKPQPAPARPREKPVELPPPPPPGHNYPRQVRLKGIDPGPPCGVKALEPRVGDRHPNEVDAFECLNCEYEWLMQPVEQEGSWVWPVTKCPRCGGLYWEWLSYDIPVANVALTHRHG